MLSPHRKSRLNQRKSATKLGKFLTQCLCSTCFKLRGTECQGGVIQHFFARFKTGTVLQIRYIFISPIPKNRRICPHARQSFHFQKLARTLKISFSAHLQMPSLFFKEQSSKRKFCIQFCLIFLLGPQNGKNCVCSW